MLLCRSLAASDHGENSPPLPSLNSLVAAEELERDAPLSKLPSAVPPLAGLEELRVDALVAERSNENSLGCDEGALACRGALRRWRGAVGAGVGVAVARGLATRTSVACILEGVG